MSTPDPVRALLNARGCPTEVVDGGLTGLVDLWERIVGLVGNSFALTLDDYLNDMDVRDLIEAALGAAAAQTIAPVEGRLAALDARLVGLTAPCECLWGDDIADEEGLDSAIEWWYFRRPLDMGPELRDDLEKWGLV